MSKKDLELIVVVSVIVTYYALSVSTFIAAK
jgi:hypothetical protein